MVAKGGERCVSGSVSDAELEKVGRPRNLSLAYGSNREPEEHGREDHNPVDSSPLRVLIPLHVACGDEKGEEDTCTHDESGISCSGTVCG